MTNYGYTDYLLSITRLLHNISDIKNLTHRKMYVMKLVQEAINNYNILEENHVYLDNESSNYHLNAWKTYLAST